MRATDTLATHFRLSEAHAGALGRLGITTVRDLLYYFPSRWEAAGGEASAGALVAGSEVSIVGTLEKLETKKSWKRRIPVSEGYLRDASGRIKLRWFNQPYIAKMYQDGTLVRASGKVSGSEGKLYLANPELQKISATEAGIFASASPDLFSIYPETRGVSSLWFRHAIKKLFDEGSLKDIEDPLPPAMLKKYNLPRLQSALHWVHQPRDLKDAEAARKRFAFEEVFMIQLARQGERVRASREKSFAIGVQEDELQAFIDDFPFDATHAQVRAIETILKDMRSGHPMSRLLEGDVGSGKTAVAAAAAYAAVRTRPRGREAGTLQVAYMAPTEILAKQHFETFIKFFNNFPINIGLITGSGCYKFPSKVARGKATPISRAQLLKWVSNGEIPVVIGTHALIQKSVKFKDLALVIIDEQHRFGLSQRRALARPSTSSGQATKPALPHLLSMTATPIPRTLALTLWGDLDLTLLDEMPAGRKAVITQVVAPKARGGAYERMREELHAGRQAYIICPRIDEPDPQKAFALQAKSVKAEAKRLKKDVFPQFRIDILHSKMKPKDKDGVMLRFLNREIDILVATSVVEVGVNVQNATVIMIEGAERFGLSQLHQLRGRVLRSEHQAYCFVVPESQGQQTLARLKALTQAKNGFELAEADMMARGAGQLTGTAQWGISDIGMDALHNLKLVEAARQEALNIVETDDSLLRHPGLKEALASRERQMHFE